VADINRADLQAIRDVAAQLTEQADSLGAEEAIILMGEAKAAMQTLKAAIDLLESQALHLIEQPILIGKTAWSKKPTFKQRPDQDRIARFVINAAVVPNEETGELPHPRDVAEAAVAIMSGLYVSPSTVPKVGGVRKIGLDMDDVCQQEHTGFELKKVDLE
jgi:hypothetical protein